MDGRNFGWVFLSIEFEIEIAFTMLSYVLNLHNAAPRTNLTCSKTTKFCVTHSPKPPKRALLILTNHQRNLSSLHK